MSDNSCLKEVKNAMKEFLEICSLNGIPAFATIAIPGAAKEYICDMVSPDVLGITSSLKENRFPDYVNIGLGFKAVMPFDKIEIDVDTDDINPLP